MLAQFAKLSLQRTTLRANTASVQSIRLLSGNGNIVPPSQPINLGHLADNPGAVTERLRLGRGPGYGKGKTAGRGHKGQKARSGNGPPRPWFEGGQTPLVKRMPKRGFVNQHAKKYQPVNLERLQHWIQEGRLDTTSITMADLLDSRCIHKIEDGVKLLADGAEEFNVPVHIEVSRASQKAIQAIEKAGGSVTCRYYNALGLRVVTRPEKWGYRSLPKFAEPVKVKDKEWYSDPKNRGYLADPAAIEAAKAEAKAL
ncbi:hypothetical protein INT44_004233 [Umbelopsis vinacea]|uniref:Large ribosomal subunit protein uL15/eL18 domain-containing protein n=1 Tax=Umbelopsis vinacea TaxID=44442 RepID=A0A8H7QCV4_9FUNG|nr:hypothetical protein INT44_004233 [Umbelopsis vinacea]